MDKNTKLREDLEKAFKGYAPLVVSAPEDLQRSLDMQQLRVNGRPEMDGEPSQEDVRKNARRLGGVPD